MKFIRYFNSKRFFFFIYLLDFSFIISNWKFTSWKKFVFGLLLIQLNISNMRYVNIKFWHFRSRFELQIICAPNRKRAMIIFNLQTSIKSFLISRSAHLPKQTWKTISKSAFINFRPFATRRTALLYFHHFFFFLLFFRHFCNAARQL